MPPIVIPDKAKVAADIFAGLLYGIAEEDSLPNLAECFYDFDEFLYDFVSAWNMLASRTLPGLMNGAILAIETLMYIPVDLLACIKAKGEIKPLEEWLS